MKLTLNCKTCGKAAKIQAEIPLSGGLVTYIWQCGHTELRERLKDEDETNDISRSNNSNSGNGNGNSGSIDRDISTEIIEDLAQYQSLDGSMAARKYQVEGIKFAKKANFNCLIADEMTLGKTIQAILTLKQNKSTLTPTLIIVKSSLIIQWSQELSTWVEAIPFKIRPITNLSTIIPGFEYYIISMDFLKGKGVLDALSLCNIKSVILDEVHFFKDPEAKRTWSLIKFIKNNNIQYKIALSGTPIKNKAVEYFTILNLLDPTRFYSLAAFKRDWLIPNEKNIYTRLNPYRIDRFREVTSKYIIRREKKEVIDNLPELNRDYQFIEITDPQVIKSYNHELDLFANFLHNSANIKANEILGWLSKLRMITGNAKCQWACDYASEFLDSTDESLAIGVHHTSVRDTLYYVFDAAGYDPLKFSGEDSIYTKARVQEKFNSGQNRLLIINMLAGGTGLNIKNCINAIVLEREWSSVDEEQFEARFREGLVKGVNIVYPIAKGTIDEFFHATVIRKRKDFKETMGDAFNLASDFASLMDLAEKTISNRL